MKDIYVAYIVDTMEFLGACDSEEELIESIQKDTENFMKIDDYGTYAADFGMDLEQFRIDAVKYIPKKG